MAAVVEGVVVSAGIAEGFVAVPLAVAASSSQVAEAEVQAEEVEEAEQDLLALLLVVTVEEEGRVADRISCSRNREERRVYNRSVITMARGTQGRGWPVARRTRCDRHSATMPGRCLA